MGSKSKSKTTTTSTSSTSTDVISPSSAIGAGAVGLSASGGNEATVIDNSVTTLSDANAIRTAGEFVDTAADLVKALNEDVVAAIIDSNEQALVSAAEFAKGERAEVLDFALEARQPDKELARDVVMFGALVLIAFAGAQYFARRRS